MKRLLLLLLLPLSAHAADWIECNLAGVSESMTHNRPVIATYFVPPVLAPNVPMNGTWTTLNVADIVPSGAKCAHVVGLLLITNDGAYTCDLHIGFRETGSPIRASRGAQTVASVGNSSRTNFSRWVPVNAAGEFDVIIEAFNKGNFPNYTLDWNLSPSCAMGVAAWVDAYGD